MLARAGFEAEGVDVGLINLETLLDPLPRILFDVSGRGMFSRCLRRVSRYIGIAGIVAGRAIPQRMQVAARRDEHAVSSRGAFRLRLEVAAHAIQRPAA